MKSRLLVLFALVGGATFAAAQVTPKSPASPSRDSAQARVAVTLFSDTETYVSIRNVRTPFRLRETVVLLPAGDYLVTGSRKGYRDVKHTLHVRDNSPAPVSLKIVCTERVLP